MDVDTLLPLAPCNFGSLRNPLAVHLVHRPVRSNARGPTEEHLQAAGALLESRASAAWVGAVGARLQVRGLLGWRAKFP
jgi:hypothetical protein